MKSNQNKYYTAVILLLAAILASILFFVFSVNDQTVDKVAYVNLERVFAEHPAKMAAEKKLNEKAATYQQELEQKAENLSGSEQKELLYSYQKELENLEAELLDSVIKEVETTIVKTAEEKQLKFVLEEKEVLYGGYDLTDEVLNNLNKKWQ